MNDIQKKAIDVVVAGHVCLDITPIFRTGKNIDINRVFSPGNLTNMEGVNISAAGAVPNVGISSRILGLEAHLMGKIGNDFFGKAVLDFLEQKQIESSMVEVKGGNTSYTIVIALPGIDRIFLHDPGVNDTFSSDDINYEKVRKAKLFHFGYPTLMRKMYDENGIELVKIFKKVKELGVITSLDMAFTEPSSGSGKADWEGILKRVLPYTDIFIPSVEETLYMVNRDYFNVLNKTNQDIIQGLDVNILQELGEKLISYGTKMAVIKCGVKGYYVRTAGEQAFRAIGGFNPINIDNWSGRELIVGTYDVGGIKSTTGAGDSSIAGFLAAFIKDRTIEESIKIAHAVATQSIQAYDVFSNIKDFNITLGIVKRGIPTIKLEIGGKYWAYDRRLKVWKGQKDKSKIV